MTIMDDRPRVASLNQRYFLGNDRSQITPEAPRWEHLLLAYHAMSSRNGPLLIFFQLIRELIRGCGAGLQFDLVLRKDENGVELPLEISSNVRSDLGFPYSEWELRLRRCLKEAGPLLQGSCEVRISISGPWVTLTDLSSDQEGQHER